MVTKDSNLGLLSKVAKFVRNPTKDWAELDALDQEPEPDSGYSKQALKEMIERKRQNDFVRRREFDHLRKLRRNGPALTAEQVGRPSFFQSSMASNPGERANTIKKIDEIEAQMSRQWWRGKQEGVTQPSALTDANGFGETPVPAPQGEDAAAFARTEVSSLTPDSARSAEDALTTVGWAGAAAAGAKAGGAPREPRTHAAKPVAGKVDAGLSEFSASKLLSVELGSGATDTELEEAAIRFANGDDAGAEAGLLAALQSPDITAQAAESWASALFDLYRATGQQASFDCVAVDFAERFGRSAPAWFSTPDLLGHTATTPLPLAPGAGTRMALWDCPPVLDLPDVQALERVSLDPEVPCRMQWSLLNSISEPAGEVFAALCAQWAQQNLELRMSGVDALERTLRARTPSGDKRVDPLWWRLRLDVLRILGMQDEFELAALEFCVTYELSPPSWVEPVCHCVREGQRGGAGAYEAAFAEPSENPIDETDPSQALTEPMGLGALPEAEVELLGEVLGDAAEALDKLQAGLADADRLVISCARLIRVDFSAAGSILNWVAMRQAEGCQVQFREVPRLVAAFFGVIGINEHARVSVRTT